MSMQGIASTTTTPQNGIDMKQALSILSARTEKSDREPTHGDSCGCCHGDNIPEQAKSMGQTIDLLRDGAHTNNRASSSSAQEEADERKRLEKEHTERLKKIQAELLQMSDKELLQAMIQAQQDRVAIYREYEQGLQVILQTSNITSYADMCAKVTASFSVLSETIKAIAEILLSSQRNRIDLGTLILQLQSHEKQKLQLTAAHHLERIRQKDQESQVERDPRIEKLLEDGVRTLQQQIHTCVEQINEVLDEIRCALLEE